jgi:hypothetical protein
MSIRADVAVIITETIPRDGIMVVFVIRVFKIFLSEPRFGVCGSDYK